MSPDSSKEDLNNGPMGETNRGAPRYHAPQAPSPSPERDFRRTIRQESFKDLKDANTLEEEKGGPGTGRETGKRYPRVPQPPPPGTQAGEGGNRYYVHSSPSKPKDREGPVKEKGVGSSGKDLKAESPKETGREAWQHHLHQVPSPIRERERQRAM